MDLPFNLATYEIGGGHVEGGDGDRIRLTLPPTARGYADAQIDDTQPLARTEFPWRPPLRLKLRARVSQQKPPGTFGFGFWNDPFSFSLGQGGAARRFPASPRACWFFYASPPSELALEAGAPPSGWEAMALDTPSIPPALLALLAGGAIVLAQVPFLRQPVMTAALKRVRAHERELQIAADEWHSYQLDWSPDSATFWVDDEKTLEAPSAPPGPLGFVAWIDNQYAVASPKGGFRFGVMPTEREMWLELERLTITPTETVKA
jgi:hypothetical protein